MAMATRCPSCETVFRVTPQQLQAHRGQVRCGHCTTVFDGFSGLAMLPDAAAAEAPLPPQEGAASPAADALEFGLEPGDEEPVPAREPVAAAAPRGAAYLPLAEAVTPAAGDAAEGAVVPALPPQEGAASPAADALEFGLEPADEEPVPARQPFGATEPAPLPIAWTVGRVPAVAIDADEDDEYLEPSLRRIWLWWAGSTLLMLALLAQAAYYYRSELAAQYPALKPVLIELCQLAGCRVPLPQRPRLVNIEASDLQVIDPGRPGLIRLTATLRNHASHDVGYPVLDLVLTNTREHTLARRIFMPEEYLERGRDPEAGIPAKVELTVTIDLDTGDLGAAGFRLDLLPMPAR